MGGDEKGKQRGGERATKRKGEGSSTGSVWPTTCAGWDGAAPQLTVHSEPRDGDPREGLQFGNRVVAQMQPAEPCVLPALTLRNAQLTYQPLPRERC